MSQRVVVELHWYVDLPEGEDLEAAVQALMIRRNREPLGKFLQDMIVYGIERVHPWQDRTGDDRSWQSS